MEGLFQPTHLIFILLIVLIIFGPGKLPDLGRGLGKGIREFKEAFRGSMGGDPRENAGSDRTGEVRLAGPRPRHRRGQRPSLPQARAQPRPGVLRRRCARPRARPPSRAP